ncbi:hypothetical protein [Sinorhizobium alkalisoli]|uniref:hypothetical protein n=1 Tax=Sinorhizobium alkalisoli TaxID=1752398 RepID=UPI00124F00CB|nr:hypothetical protein [Sinorhizobium alkalisoli]QFI65761.1 hypothetical protein EKH55_0887 [Sinorhizobium alkalisoli]
MSFNHFVRFTKAEDAMAQRAIERGVGLDRSNSSRVELSAMVSEFAAKKGIRKFADGESSSYDSIKSFLADRGYELAYRVNRYTIKKAGARGLGNTMTWAKVIDFVDEIRRSENLQPLRAA